MRIDIKDARIAKGLTQDQLADQIGKSQAVVSRYESGEIPIDAQIAPLIASALGMNILAVLYGIQASKEKAA